MRSKLKPLLLVLALAFLSTSALLWHRGVIQRWIRAKVVEYYVHRIQPGLPFKIEEATADASWKDFWKGKLSRLELLISAQNLQIRMSGPIEIKRPSSAASLPSRPSEFEVSYPTKMTLSWKGEAKNPVQISSEFNFELHAKVHSNLKSLISISTIANAEEFAWNVFGLNIKTPTMHAKWEPQGETQSESNHKQPTQHKESLSLFRNFLTIQFKSGKISSKSGGGSQAPLEIQTDALSINLSHHPASGRTRGSSTQRYPGEKSKMITRLGIILGSTQTLHGDLYRELPLEAYLLEGEIKYNEKSEPERLDLSIGSDGATASSKKGTPNLKVSLRNRGDKLNSIESTISLNSARLEDLIFLTNGIFGKQIWPMSVETKQGKLDALVALSTAKVPNLLSLFEKNKNPLNFDFRSLFHSLELLPESHLRIENLKLREKGGDWSISPLSFHWNAPSTKTTLPGFFSAKQDLLFKEFHLNFKAVHLTIFPFTLSLQSLQNSSQEDEPGLKSQVAFETHFLEKSLNQSWIRGNLPLDIGETKGWVSLPTPTQPFDFELQTSLELLETPWADLRKVLCLDTDNAISALSHFPAKLRVSFPSLLIDSTRFDPTGQVSVSAFEGKLELSEIGLYDYLSSVPELDFDFQLDQVRLDQLGQWSGFGEMDGTLNATAKNVVIQGWFPTQYEFLAQIIPQHHRQVVFSPDAMKNLVRVFASEAMDQIPSFAQWFAFGFPSRLFGGYDIAYAGIKLESKNGQIQLETLDPPETASKEKKHYFLYGPRFKIPLRSFHYPLVLDATAMGNFVRQVTLTLQEIMRNKREKHKPPETLAHEPQQTNIDKEKIAAPLSCRVPPLE